MQLIKKFRRSLFQEVHPASLGLFRILVGIVLFCQTSWFIGVDFISENIYKPVVHFQFFEFLSPLPKNIMKLLMFCLLTSSALITIGKWFKYACAFFCISFTYLWLLDKGYFNNHYYFISLLTFLLMFTNADSWGAVGTNEKSRKTSIPYWQVFIIKAQIVIVFFVAGVNKLNPYWMYEFQPMKHILETKALVDGYPWLNSEVYFAIFSWFGMAFDILIGFLLWIKPTRKIAIILYVIFNITNFWLFHNIGEIGFFPFLLLACLAIFISPQKVAQKFSFNKNEKRQNKINVRGVNLSATSKGREALIYYSLVTYIIFHLILPFRHLLYEGNVDWTGEGQRFSWRMKIMYKESDMHFYLVEEGRTEKREVNVNSFLTQKQYTNLIYYPDLIPEVAKYIKKEGIRRGIKNPRVVADYKIGFMGGEKRYLVNPDTDLSQLSSFSLSHPTWILPLNQ